MTDSIARSEPSAAFAARKTPIILEVFQKVALSSPILLIQTRELLNTGGSRIICQRKIPTVGRRTAVAESEQRVALAL
jgi:hypothetical protein